MYKHLSIFTKNQKKIIITNNITAPDSHYVSSAMYLQKKIILY